MRQGKNRVERHSGTWHQPNTPASTNVSAGVKHNSLFTNVIYTHKSYIGMGKDLRKRETESQKPVTNVMKLFTTVNDECSKKLEGLFLAGLSSQV